MSIGKTTRENERYSEAAEEYSFASDLKKIKEGNQQARSDFIGKYKPFVLRVTSITLDKYVDTQDSDEFSIALSAFNEAIDRFESGNRNKFLSYAEKVIKSRIIDYLRKNKTCNGHIQLSLDGENDKEFGEQYPSPDSYTQYESIEDREEIENLKKSLAEFDITLNDLLLSTPRHKDTRELCFDIACILAGDNELLDILYKSKSIPRSELAKKAQVHENTIGKHRKYIIAICLILNSDLEVSKNILKYAGK